VPYLSTMDVALIRWPSDEALRVELAQIKHPRLLLVEPRADPPHISDVLEDWVRLPVSREDRNARIRVLQSRVEPALPLVTDDGSVHYRGASARLSENQVHLMRMLIERFGAVVGREALVASVWPDSAATAGNLRVMVARLRPVLVPLGLDIRAVRSRGYLLTTSERQPHRR
jgi:DNA-binding response OmpR family regulator